MTCLATSERADCSNFSEQHPIPQTSTNTQARASSPFDDEKTSKDCEENDQVSCRGGTYTHTYLFSLIPRGSQQHHHPRPIFTNIYKISLFLGVAYLPTYPPTYQRSGAQHTQQRRSWNQQRSTNTDIRRKKKKKKRPPYHRAEQPAQPAQPAMLGGRAICAAILRISHPGAHHSVVTAHRPLFSVLLFPLLDTMQGGHRHG
ncbi:hypothetical protein IWZ01DRAFT_58550 [Phyllosticta capitalensis]